ncbi:MAG: hypothetical protein GXP47_00660 [Acidobacteria bacterium]|nr:hypothetical protein [Acidobacteriota bacterium]
MKYRCLVAVAVVMVLAGGAGAADYVLPAFAYNLPGHGKNLWTTELYISNPGSETVLVDPPVVLEGRLVVPHPCVPPVRPLEVPPHASVVWSSEEIAFQLGCAVEVVGALLLHADGDLVVDSRMVNVSGEFVEGDGEVPQIILAGYSQQMPGLPVADLPVEPRQFMLPSLIWHRNACGSVAFDNYVGFANPDDAPVEVTLDLGPELRELGMVVDGNPVELPYTLELPARSWRQIHVTPESNQLPVCLDPERFDLYVTTRGPVAMYASVVDRSSQDPRTVFPVALSGDPASK